MSCSVSLVPYLLLTVVSALVESKQAYDRNKLAKNLPNINNYIDNYQSQIPAEHFVEKDFETIFMDKSLLLKTLEEHGVTDIMEEGNNIKCDIETFSLLFTKTSESSPYSLHISCNEKDNAEEKISDLNNEYCLNVQEETYLNLISKLKNNNMTIETEEVLEDNTIVLTVNLE